VLNPRLTLSGILPPRLRRTKHGTEVIERAKAEFSDITVFEPAIPSWWPSPTASAEGKPLIESAPTLASPPRI
jgi:hypothetical protein